MTRTVAQPIPAADPAATVSRAILADLFGPPAERTFAVRLWDGAVEAPGAGNEPPFTLVLRRPGALRRMLLPPTELALGEAYLRDDFDIEGDMEEAATILPGGISARLRSPAVLARLVSRLRALPDDDLPEDNGSGTARFTGRRHSRKRDAAAVRSHYDAGNDFYALWLDRRMVYSCAYFPTGTEDIDAAQEAKLDLICRKLRLKPGESLLDIGCGWGSLAIYAAENYGVRSTGITLSEPQAALARRRISEAGLDDRCRVEVRDYRDFPQDITFDKVVSVGMFEHVGRAKLPAYFAEAHRLLRPGGLFLNHGIVTLSRLSAPARAVASALGPRTSFIQRYVFPDGELVTPAEVLRYAEAAGFETRDLESLREHYALTVRHWVRRLESRHEEAARLAGEQTYRVWRLYMAACARAFAKGRIGVVQTLFSKADKNGVCQLPATRADLYREWPAEQGGAR
ncbi:MAG: cyclopropane-fatty-acyl-phospholipid synthase family protein [Rubrobacteraceae bacterium]